MGNQPSNLPRGGQPSSTEDYHLQFRNSRPGKEFKQTVDVYLRKVFRGDPPLKYERHFTTRDGYVLVRFRLSSRHAARSLESAGEELCQLIFKKRGSNLDLLTENSLLGVLASCEAWQDFFNKAFFDASLKQGPGFLEALEVDDSTSYIPAWAMVLSFACFAGLNFSIFTSGGPTSWWEASKILLGSTTVNKSADFLERCGHYLKTQHQNVPNVRPTEADLGLEAEQHNQKLDRQLTRTVEELKIYCNQNMASHQRRLKKVRQALFEVARVAAEAVASNQKLLQALKQKRFDAITQIAGRTGGIAASASTFFSAFTFTTEVTGASMAPLSTWLASGPIALKTTTVAACTCPWVALTAVCFAIYNLNRGLRDHEEQGRLEGQVNRYECRKSLVIYAWSVVSDTEMVLGWVHCTKAIDPRKYLIADADEETLAKMKDIIEQYEKMAREPRRKKEKFVQEYLKRQRETLMSIQEKLKEVPESHDGSPLFEDSE
ncbi:hypothetical protein BKA65DRAFT_581699 [Rhexocercosporidium sp. MPI-PUGE-AT-0058]|nr:hypothetical protein BKA65DRAFT_581699 [Rhexocercosporidium sp. MPI-PUGE-AT-0058]